MLLKEFFGRSLDVKPKSEEKDKLSQNDELFWYMLDHDRLHKDYALPLSQRIKKAHHKGNPDTKSLINAFMPMVEKGCMEFYHRKKLTGKIDKLFPEDMKEEMCQKLYDHFCEDILSDGKLDGKVG